MKKRNIFVLLVLMGSMMGAAVSMGISQKTKNKEIKKAWGYSAKHLALFQLMNQWVQLKQEGKKLASYFEKYGYKKIAVYGMSYAGETLLNELKETEVQVVYGIDQKADEIYSEVKIFTVNDELPSVDVIVVTAITFFDEIEEQLHEKMECPIISLEDIVYDL